jgi:polyphosphate kinase 2
MSKKKDKKKDKKEAKAKQKTPVIEAAGPADPSDGNPAEMSSEPQPKMSRKDFEKALEPLQVELVKLQEWVKYTGAKICVVFEGRDTAGKGGIIKRITERTSPRVFKVVALGAPTEREKSQMYIQRYIQYMPAAGEVVLFDRSWYNRAGVERVMGFATKEQIEQFLKYTPAVERVIIQSGVHLIKYWLDVSMDEQERRFHERQNDGRKLWKLTPMDGKSYSRWYDYSRARDAMFAATDCVESPWYVVDSNDQRRGRLNCISHFLSLIPYTDVPFEPVKLGKRQEKGDYKEPDYPYRHIKKIY